MPTPAVRFREISGIEAAEARLDRLAGAGLRGFGGGRIEGALSRDGVEQVRALFRARASLESGRRFGEMEVELAPELAARLRRADPEIVSRRLGEAAQRALSRAVPSIEGVCAVRLGADDRPRIQVLVSSPQWMRPELAAAAVARFERAWLIESHRAFDVKPTRGEPERAVIEKELHDAWEVGADKYRAAISARIDGRGSQEAVQSALVEVQQLRGRYVEFTSRMAFRPEPSVEGTAARAAGAVREIRFTKFQVERGGEVLGGLEAAGQARVMQEAVERVLGKGVRVLASPAPGEPKNLDVVVYSQRQRIGEAERTKLSESLPAALTSVAREHKLQTVSVGRVLFERDLPAAQKEVKRLPENVKRAMPSAAVEPSLIISNPARVLAHRDVVLPSAAKFLVRIPAADRDRALQDAVRAALPAVQGAVVSSRLSGESVIIRVLVENKDQAAQLERPLAAARITNNLSAIADGRPVAQGPSPAPATPAIASTAVQAAGADQAVEQMLRPGVGAQVRTAVDAAKDAGRHMASMASTPYKIAQAGGDAHAIAHHGVDLLARVMPPAMAQTFGRALQRIGHELVDLTRGRE